MAAESIGALVPTAIPGYSDAADIQAALRLYHYGSYAYNPANTSAASLVNPSIAYTLNDIQDQINDISGGGLTDSIFTAKGDLLSASASSTPLILASGSNNQFLIVNTSTATGLQWSNTLVSPVVTGLTLNDSSIVFEGSAADANETTLTVTNPTADRTITLPDATGTVVLDTLAQTLTNKTFTDSTTFFQDETDNSKKLQLQLSSISTTTTRTLTVPNTSGTIVTTGNLTDITSTGTLTSLTVSGDIVLSGTNAPGSIIDELTLLLMGAL